MLRAELRGRRWLLAIIWICAWLADARTASAATLTITGLRGNDSIDLGELDQYRLKTHEEVAVFTDPQQTTQYRLVQRLVSPLVNERGTRMDPRWIVMEVFGASSGTIRQIGATPVSTADMELFISDLTGRAERLTILYSVRLEANAAGEFRDLLQAGTYTGTMHYVLQNINGASVRTRTVPMRLRVNPILSLRLSSDSQRRLAFGSLRPEDRSEPRSVTLTYLTNIPGRIQVEHLVDLALLNERADAFPLSAIELQPTFDDTAHPPIPMQERLVLSPETNPDTSFQRRLTLTYYAHVPKGQFSGTYRGVIQLGLSGNRDPNVAVTQIPMELQVTPVLSLTVSSPTGEEAVLNFGQIEPGQTTPMKQLKIRVDSNTRQSYRVTEELPEPLSSQHAQLPEDVLQCAPGLSLAGPLIQAMSFVPVQRSAAVFFSNALGSPAEWYMHCQAAIPSNTRFGTYHAIIKYRLSVL